LSAALAWFWSALALIFIGDLKPFYPKPSTMLAKKTNNSVRWVLYRVYY